MSSDAPTRRERKKSATREALLESALALFAERGFAATTVEDITERADVAPRTFFRYFPDKAAVLQPAKDEYLELFRDELRSGAPDEPVLAIIHRALCTTLATFADDRDRILLQHRIMTEAGLDHGADEFANSWAAFEAAVADLMGVRVEDDPRPTVLTGMVVGIVAATVRRWLEGGASADLGALVDEGFAIVAALVHAAED